MPRLAEPWRDRIEPTWPRIPSQGHLARLSQPRRRHSSHDGDPVARIILVILIVSVAVSPRLRIGQLDAQRAIDLRVQDILLPFTALFLLVRGEGRSAKIFTQRIWGPWCQAFCFAALLLTTISAIMISDISLIRRVTFLGRALEVFLLATIVCTLARLAGPSSTKWALHAIKFAVLANVLWCAYQVLIGRNGTLLGGTLGDDIDSYGPKLIGEPSASGTGAFFAFAASFAVAKYRTARSRRILPLMMFGTALICTFLAQSRSALAAFCLLTLVLLWPNNQDGELSWLGRLFFLLIPISASSLLIIDGFSQRMSRAEVEHSTTVRMQNMWEPIIRIFVENPIYLTAGAGPGALPSPEFPFSEAHNIALRALIDFGMFGAILLIILILTPARLAFRVARCAYCPPATRLLGNLTWLGCLAMLIEGLALDSFTTVTCSHLLMLSIGLFAAAYVPHTSDPAGGHLIRASPARRGSGRSTSLP